MLISNIKVPTNSWSRYLMPELDKPYMRELFEYLQARDDAGATIYPAYKDIFNAFQLTDFNDVRVVILGQDPYHGPNQAHGLSFSVEQGIKVPPSLLNMFKEINSDLGFEIPVTGDLTPWAQQGVLLLNSVLSVEQAKAGSHQGKGWEGFTDAVIETLSQEHKGLVFMLWGSYAQKKGKVVDASKHCILSAPHPSPLSSYRGFFGCKHFSKANDYLMGKGSHAINWRL